MEARCKRSAEGGLANREGLSPTLPSAERKAMDIAPFSQGGDFGPDDFKAMSIALDEVCDKLHLAHDQQEEREVLLKRIIALARHGERDFAVLRDAVLREFAVRAWRGMSYSDGPDDRQAPAH